MLNLQGERQFVPFRQLGQYEDLETELYYNRFRYYSAETGCYISQDPIGLKGGSPNLYAYVNNCNGLVDIFVLDFFYQLMKNNEVVYNGITKNPIKDRMADHVRDGKDFTDFRYIEVDDRVASRNLEGSALHNANGIGLQNATRLDGQYWHSYDPNNLKPGRTYFTADEIETKMKDAKTGKIENGKVKLCN